MKENIVYLVVLILLVTFLEFLALFPLFPKNILYFFGPSSGMLMSIFTFLFCLKLAFLMAGIGFSCFSTSFDWELDP